MKELRQLLIRNILTAKDEAEVERLIIDVIALLRSHMVIEFVIARFIDKLIVELSKTNEFNNTHLLAKIRSLHPAGLQWDFK